MVEIAVDSREKVDRVHRKAPELGGKDEGPAGPRFDGFYAGYFRDLDGNRLDVFCVGQAQDPEAAEGAASGMTCYFVAAAASLRCSLASARYSVAAAR